ncbi:MULTISPECIES: hypothetical protein [unclassified Enterococcus]|uniref:hypothetical protein n=1 Tax=unclassified Enterococcus TaxID=2608891 RepID=UPI0013EBEC51|nr:MULTISPECIES: hypothetical protein [unclassified Enterococcus]
MKQTTKVALSALTILSSLSIAQSVQAYSWVGGEADPNTVYDSVQKQDSATIPAEGTFKEWDPTNPGPGPEPTDPVEWIDVSIPTKVLFGQTDATEGQIVAPIYKIQNNSVKGVKVSVGNFVKGQDADKVPELVLNMTGLSNNTSIPLVNPTTTPQFPRELVTLQNQNDVTEFSFSGNVGANFQFGEAISPQYELVLRFEAVGV